MHIIVNVYGETIATILTVILAISITFASLWCLSSYVNDVLSVLMT